MSLHYEFYIACDLKLDTPPEVIEILQSIVKGSAEKVTLKHQDFETEWASFFEEPGKPLLYGPGFTCLQLDQAYRFTRPATYPDETDVYFYTLQIRQNTLDDIFYEYFWDFILWLVQYCKDGFIGYYREELETSPELLYTQNGKMYTARPHAHRAMNSEGWIGKL